MYTSGLSGLFIGQEKSDSALRAADDSPGLVVVRDGERDEQNVCPQ
jgi:hypothetical protein